MNNINVIIKPKNESYIPVYKHESDCCADCFAKLDKDLVIEAGKRSTIPLGFCLELPENFKAVISPRSGLASKSGIKAVRGEIDNGYRGEVCCTLFNNSEVDFVVKDKDRICQILFEPYYKAVFYVADSLTESDRGEAGFGSTGV